MKGRLIGALWIIGALALFYFAFDGTDFPTLFIVSLLMCAVEISSISQCQPYRMKPDACGPAGAWCAQLYIVCFASLACLMLTKEQILFVVIVCSLSDVGAFTFGKLLGKHKAKFSAKISPNKTIEGYVGGILCTAIAIPICPLLGLEYDPQLIVFLAICGVTAEIGDLLGSATKRQLNIKDSGDGIRNVPIFNVIEYPLRGHGGYLDRLDSISLNLLLFALINVPKY